MIFMICNHNDQSPGIIYLNVGVLREALLFRFPGEEKLLLEYNYLVLRMLLRHM